MAKPKGYWTFDKCKKSALGFDQKRKWGKLGEGAASAARKNKWFEECTAHMEKRTPRSYWTFERCQEEATNYSSRSEWNKKSGRSYSSALENNWLDDCCKHMENLQIGWKPFGYWTFQRCKEKSKKYERSSDWEKGDRKSWDAALRHEWLPELTKDYKKLSQWDLETCLADSQKYKTFVDWRCNSPVAYRAARERGWLEEVTRNIIRWTWEDCLEDIKKYDSKSDWKENSPEIYQSVYGTQKWKCLATELWREKRKLKTARKKLIQSLRRIKICDHCGEKHFKSHFKSRSFCSVNCLKDSNLKIRFETPCSSPGCNNSVGGKGNLKRKLCKPCKNVTDVMASQKKMFENDYERFKKRKYTRLKSAAKLRRVRVEISFDEYVELAGKSCSYCGDCTKSNKSGGLDRINNEIGYSKTNLVPCCTRCNKIKGFLLTYKEMITGMRAIKHSDKLRHVKQKVVKEKEQQLKRRYNTGRSQARFRNIAWNLTLKEYSETFQRSCAYCGREEKNRTGYGLDRINPEEGYNLENVIACCGVCNRIKNNVLTYDEMVPFMESIIYYRLSNGQGFVPMEKLGIKKQMKAKKTILIGDSL